MGMGWGTRRARVLLCWVVAMVVASQTALVARAGTADDSGALAPYRGFGDPGGFWNILPPGSDGVQTVPEVLAAEAGGAPSPHVDDALGRYESLVFAGATPGLTSERVGEFYKDASFGVPPQDIDRVYSPAGRDDVVVIRDRSAGVPHIYGSTRDGTMFAAGYTGAEDRLFLMDLLRHLGRAELASFLGASPGNLAMDREQLATAPYVEADLVAQGEALRADPERNQSAADADSYIAGVNAYIAEALSDPTLLPVEYPALQQVPAEFVVEDIIAIASLVGGIFGKGGGGELSTYCGLRQLEAALGPEEAGDITEDLLAVGDEEAPVTATVGEFPYPAVRGPVDQHAVPALDCASLRPLAPPSLDPVALPAAVTEVIPVPPAPATEAGRHGATRAGTIDFPWGSADVLLSGAMSNALVVNGDRTTTGQPIAVFGPQTGYFMPQLLVEKDIHGPGIDVRGVAFAGTDVYVQLGRGRDYAWSATAAGADNTDTFVLRLCEPDGSRPTSASMGYLHDEVCIPIEAHQELRLAKPSAGGVPEDPAMVVLQKYFERSPHYGPVTARGQLIDGTPIAVASRRSTYRSELRSALGFRQINDPTFMTEGVDSFRQAMGAGIDYTFNWFYVDGDDVAYQHSCRCPQRAAGVDPQLPVWGTGEWDWDGWLALEGQPTVTNPPQGWISSWNNKQARGFEGERSFAAGPIYRSLLIDDRIGTALAGGPVDVGQVVDIMALAGTTDLRSQELLPVLEHLLGGEPPPAVDRRVGELWTRLRAWAADDGGHRRDHDDNGDYEHAVAIAAMDAWWPLLYDAIFAAGTGEARHALGFGIHDPPQNHLGSAFNGGAYGHAHKDLRRVAGLPVTDPYHRMYCGGGDLSLCRHLLWSSLGLTVAALEQEFGTGDVERWARTRADDEIRHTAVGLASVPPIHWVNRPTFQQVVQLPSP